MKLYSQCQKKQASRQVLLDHYVGGEYWTMCGPNDGPGCEYAQVGIEPHLFHGVDVDPHTIALNRSVYPETNWFHGDLYETMCDEAGDIGLANVDTIWEPEEAARYAGSIMLLEPRVLVLNTIMKQWRNDRRWQAKDVMQIIEQTAGYRRLRPTLAGWFEYDGTGRCGTVMGTFVFERTA